MTFLQKKRKHSSEDEYKSEVKEPKEEPMDEYHPDERDSDSPDVKSEPESGKNFKFPNKKIEFLFFYSFYRLQDL